MRPLPIINLKNRLICQSQRPGSAGLGVFVYDLPTHGRTACREEARFFIYRVGQGELWLTAPELGLIRHPVRGEHSPLVPPRVSLCAEWAGLSGRVATFLFCPHFLASLSAGGGQPEPDSDGRIPGSLLLPSPDQGQVNNVPFFPNGAAIPFRGARQGQLYLTDLYLYDKFGRELFVIESESDHPGNRFCEWR
jgi:hypothetical protein